MHEASATGTALPAADPASPIGVFDSGVGGLSVLREIRALLPHEHLLFVGDSGHAPYGDKPDGYVRERTLRIGDFLAGHGAKALVIACNTGTMHGAEALRQSCALPVVAMEPAVKPATAATRSGVVGVLVTVATTGSARFAALLARFGGDIKVITVPAPGLVECIERGDLDGPEVRKLAERYIRPMLEGGADAIVLGSTHYVFLRPLVAEIAGPNVTLIDTGAAVARQLQRVLAERGLLNDADARGSERFWSSAAGENASRVMSLLYGKPIEVAALPAPFA